MKKSNWAQHPEFIRGENVSFARMKIKLKELHGVNTQGCPCAVTQK